MNNPIISVVGLGKMGLGIYKRLCNENIIIYGYDNNSKIIKNNTDVNFLENKPHSGLLASLKYATQADLI